MNFQLFLQPLWSCIILFSKIYFYVSKVQPLARLWSGNQTKPKTKLSHKFVFAALMAIYWLQSLRDEFLSWKVQTVGGHVKSVKKTASNNKCLNNKCLNITDHWTTNVWTSTNDWTINNWTLKRTIAIKNVKCGDVNSSPSSKKTNRND